MKLTIRAIIKWELLVQKPFSRMNYSDEDDIISLFYVCKFPDEVNMSLSEFKEGLTEDSFKDMIDEFEKQTRIDSQFQPVPPEKKEDSKDLEPIYIKDIIPMLVMNGLDVYYAMNEMKLYEIPVFLNAYDRKIRNKLESSRLWTYIQVSPNLSKAVKTPKDLFPFSWEIEEQNELSKEDMEKGISMFEAFMNSGKQKI